jgi:hypothetical protein
MKTFHDIEVELPDKRVLKASITCEWVYERNPGDKEKAHYHSEDDGYYLEDWSPDGEIDVDGKLIPLSELDPDATIALDKAVENLSPDNE